MHTKHAAIHLACFLLAAYCAAAHADTKDTRITYTLTAEREAGQTDRVTVLMEVGGDFKERPGAKEQRTRMSGVAHLKYDEMTLAADSRRLRAARYYETAQSSAKFKDGAHNPTLGESRRLVGVAVDPTRACLFGMREPLTRDELEVIDIVGNSLLLDRLLPERPVAIGDTWKPADGAAAALLGLDSVTRNDLRCTLKEVTNTVARVELSGGVEGPVNDTKSSIELKGKYRFDLRSKRIDWFAMLTKENRGTSRVAVGFDVTVRFQMTVAPRSASPELARENLAGQQIEPTPEKTQLRYESPQDRWQITYDRQWYLNSDDRENAVLKLVRDGAMIGQCNIASLPQREPDKLVSLEDYQEDVKKALGENFGEFVNAKQWVDESKHRVLRVIVNGTARDKSTDVPISWVYYHVADPEGRQVALTFTVEQERMERFAEADRPIVASLRFAKAAGTRKG
jgi:hypothetical protein